jgi:hypothetical protein
MKKSKTKINNKLAVYRGTKLHIWFPRKPSGATGINVTTKSLKELQLKMC